MLPLDDLTAPFDPIPPEVARAALATHWGISIDHVERLDTERDDTFRAGDFVLKVAHPNDDPVVIAMQSAVMAHVQAADPGIPIQRIVPTQSGEPSAIVDGRIARVLTWLDGDPVDDQDLPLSFFTEAGRMLGRLNRAMAGFDHPGAYRRLAWDIASAGELADVATEPAHAAFLTKFASETTSHIDMLPWQVIHNDGHPGNLLVTDGRLAGILDFGDTVHSARICDLAVALTYLVPDDGETWDEANAFRDGYLEVVPMHEAELADLPQLMAARTVMRTVINQALQRDAHSDPYGFYAANDRKLRRILEEA